MTKHQKSFGDAQFPPLSSQYQIPLPPSETFPETVSVKLTTIPELAGEFMQLQMEEVEEEAELFDESLIPDNALVSIRVVNAEQLETWRSQAPHHQTTRQKIVGDELPVLLIQTSGPKAKIVIQQIEACGGLIGMGLNPARGLWGDSYELGLIQAKDKTLFLFGEFEVKNPHEAVIVNQLREKSKASKKYCAIAIAKGNSGKSKGRPEPKDIMALYDIKFLTPQDFGIGIVRQDYM